MSKGEVAERLRSSGYVFAPSRSGKRFWEQPGTGSRLPEDHAFTLGREEERQLLSEAGWAPEEIEGAAFVLEEPQGVPWRRGVGEALS